MKIESFRLADELIKDIGSMNMLLLEKEYWWESFPEGIIPVTVCMEISSQVEKIIEGKKAKLQAELDAL